MVSARARGEGRGGVLYFNIIADDVSKRLIPAYTGNIAQIYHPYLTILHLSILSIRILPKPPASLQEREGKVTIQFG